jgi:hypothetical protein
VSDRSPSWRAGAFLAGWLAIVVPATGLCATAPAYDDAGDVPAPQPGTAESENPARWRLPPITYWGTLTYENRFDTGEQQPRTMQQLMTARVSGSSYLWKPWFATVNGGIGVSFARFQAGDGAPGSRDTFLSGNGQVQLFPTSRFPFEAHFDLGDSRAGGGVVAGSDYTTARYGFSQRYRPESGAYTLFGSYERTTQTGQVHGGSAQDTATAEYRSNWRDHSLQVTAQLNLARSDSTAQETEFDSVVARHNYGPSPALMVDTTASVVRNRYDLLTGATDIAIAQLSSLGVWRPTDRPLTVTGTALVGALRASGAVPDTRTAAGSIGANYQQSRNLQFSGAFNAGVVSGTADGETTHGESLGAIYTGDTRNVAGFTYDWSAAANAGYQSTATGEATLLAAQVNQTLGRVVMLPDDSSLLGNLGVNLGAGHGDVATNRLGSASGNAVQVGTSASLTWNKSAGGSSGYARITLNDTRQVAGEERPTFQFANLQVSGTWNLTRNDILSGDFTWQYTRQDTGFVIANGTTIPLTGVSRQTTTTTGANISYTRNRVFGVPRLRFVSQLQITDSAILQQNVLALPEDQIARWWDNRLTYQIGRLSATLALRVYEIQGVRREGIYFRVERTLGSGPPN